MYFEGARSLTANTRPATLSDFVVGGAIHCSGAGQHVPVHFALSHRAPVDDRVMPYAGHCLTPVRRQGQVALPAFVRRNLDFGGPGLFIGLHRSGNCLVGASSSWWQGLASAQRDASPASPGATGEAIEADRRTFGFCAEYYRPDRTITLPDWARAIALITDEALFVGTGTTFELWSPAEVARSGDTALSALLHSARKLG